MKKWLCKVCGYIHEGPEPPPICPVCKVGPERFELIEEGLSHSQQHKLGIARGLDEQLEQGLRQQTQQAGERAGLLSAMARAADREGLPEVAAALTRFAQMQTQQAGRLSELMGDKLSASTQQNLKEAVKALSQGSEAKAKLADIAKASGFDAIQEALNELARDEADQSQALAGQLKRYFS